MPTSALLSAADGSLWMGVISTVGVMRIQGNKLTMYGAAQGLPGGYVMTMLEDPAAPSGWVTTLDSFDLTASASMP